MEQYIEALKELNIQLRDTLAIQKELVEKLKWAVDFFHDAVLEEDKKNLILEKIDNEKIEDLSEEVGDEKLYETEKLSEEESEVLP
jgi:low affinity Fe/Cu permease